MKGGRKRMKNINGWLFLLIALMLLLPLVRIDTGSWGPWINVIAFAIIGFMMVKGK